MRTTLLMLVLLGLGACASHDTVTMDEPTVQQFDLNDPDHDGVINARDRCEGTILGAAIDNYGCGQAKTVSERRELKILFANDSAKITAEYMGEIEALANAMRQFPETQVTIEGHCSHTGGYEYNMALSRRRADAVARELIRTYGIDSSRVTTVGYGYNNPVDSSDTPEAHAKNRRVVADIAGNNTGAEMKWTIYSVDQGTRK